MNINTIFSKERNFAKGNLLHIFLYSENEEKVKEVRDYIMSSKNITHRFNMVKNENDDYILSTDGNFSDYILSVESEDNIFHIRIIYVSNDGSSDDIYAFSLYRKDMEDVFNIIFDAHKSQYRALIVNIEYILSTLSYYNDDKMELFNVMKNILNYSEGSFHLINNIEMEVHRLELDDPCDNHTEVISIAFYIKIGYQNLLMNNIIRIYNEDLQEILTLIENMHFTKIDED